MAIVTKLVSTISVKDPILTLDFEQTKSFSVGSINALEATYVLPMSQPSFQEVSMGDIVSIKQVFISVVDKPLTFAGVSVAFAATLPTEGSLTVTDTLVLSGIIANKLWIKNLDTIQGCTLIIVLAGD